MIETCPKVIDIQFAAKKGEKMEHRYATLLLKDVGIPDDRYGTGKGSYSKAPRENVQPNPFTARKIGRDVTIISKEAIQEANKEHGSDFTFADTRRNILVEGMSDLRDLIGQLIVIGSTVLYINEECDPCDVPSKDSGKKGFKEAFQNGRGGIRAIVMDDGDVEIGDQLLADINTPNSVSTNGK